MALFEFFPVGHLGVDLGLLKAADGFGRIVHLKSLLKGPGVLSEASAGPGRLRSGCSVVSRSCEVLAAFRGHILFVRVPFLPVVGQHLPYHLNVVVAQVKGDVTWVVLLVCCRER